MFYLTIHSTHFIYSYMASDIWLRTILIVREACAITACSECTLKPKKRKRSLLQASNTNTGHKYLIICFLNVFYGPMTQLSGFCIVGFFGIILSCFCLFEIRNPKI